MATKSPTIVPVVMCGGSGTRLWPSSRKSFPKQFSPLVGERSLYQRALLRLSDPAFCAPLVLTNEAFRFLARDQAEEIGLSDARIVLEPEARDTAPSVLIAAMLLKDRPNDLMLIAPSDHLIKDRKAFLEAVQIGVPAALAGQFVTFGVEPTSPETGYGYLELTQSARGPAAVPLAGFVEKPDLESASAMQSSDRFLWNSGIFLCRVSDVLAAFDRIAPEIVDPSAASISAATEDLGFLRLGPADYATIPAQSFDYAIMEKASNISAVLLSSGWSDLGSWSSLFAALSNGENVIRHGHTTAVDCADSVLRSEDDGIHLVGLGLKNTVAVAMRDAVLVADLSHDQKLKEVVDILRADAISQADEYPRYHRPWGWYETLCAGERFQVKRIMVKPGGILSLQSHVHRAEHWVIVEGTAKVTVEDDENLVTENQSVYIPLGAVHRLQNPGKVPMLMIEVQTGAYLGEDDVQRFEDAYDRD